MSTENSTKEVAKTSNAVVRFDFFNPDQFQVMQRASKMFAMSDLVPKIYKAKDKDDQKAIANCMIAIDISTRIGASPLMVMQNLDIIDGKPSWSSKFLTATVNACGKYNSMKYRMKNNGPIGEIDYIDYVWNDSAGKKLPVVKTFKDKIDNWQCIAYTSERENPDEILESIPVSLEMAIKEGWYTRSGSKWKTMPQLMLQYRSVTFWTRSYAPELSMGIRPQDEIEDYVEYEDVTEQVEKEIKANGNKTQFDMDKKTETPVTEKTETVPGATGEPDLTQAPDKKQDAEQIKMDGPGY